MDPNLTPAAASARPPASAARPAAELTLRAIAIGAALSVVMGAANVYLGLKAGMTVSASIPAAVLGTLLLRMLSRERALLEANQIQTAASAGESLAAGVLFTMPALLLIGYWKRFDFWTTTLVAFSGGLLGILFMIPMRRVFVVENRELPYPEGVACAAVLEAGAGAPADAASPEAGAGARSILWGALLGASFKFATSFLGVLRGVLEAAWLTSSGRVFYLGSDMSPALLAVGFIVRLNVAVLVFAGAVLGWLICMPLLPEIEATIGNLAPGWVPHSGVEGAALDRAWMLWSGRVRYIGVGAMAVGGIASLWRVRAGLRTAVGVLVERSSPRSGAVSDPLDRDLAPRVVLALSLVVVLLIAGLYRSFTGGWGITALTTASMVILSFFFVAVASYIVGLVGNSNSPVSGMTITAVLFTGALLYAWGFSGTQGMVATLGVAAIVCCAACTSGDVCNDLKTGSLVGAAPYKQQIMQVLGVAVAALVMAPVLQLLNEAYVIGSRELSAPQADLFANLVRGFFGDGVLPWGLVAAGALLGCGILIVDAMLARRGAAFRAHLMPVAVGMYLPFGLSVPILVGGLLAWLSTRERPEPEAERSHAAGVLVASGVIAGEALMGVGIALLLTTGFTAKEPVFPGQAFVTAVAGILVAATLWYSARSARGGYAVR